MTPLVSVVIPTYNHAHFLGRSVKSVIDQTFSDWEAIVVDNHSEDNSDEVVSGFRDDRIRMLKIRNHGVIAASRNLGIREACGEWVAFLDSDDCWYPRKLETAMNAAAGEEYDVISNDELRVDIGNGDRRPLHYGPYRPDFYKMLLLEGNKLSPSATVIRREFLTSHGLGFGEAPEFTTVEDYDLWLNLARSGARFKFIKEILGEYVIHSANNSASVERHWKNRESLLRNHVFNVQKIDPSPERLWRRISAQLGLGRAKQLFGAGEIGRAVRLALATAADSPLATVSYLAAKAGRALTPSRS